MKYSCYLLISVFVAVASFILGGYCFHPNSIKPNYEIFLKDRLVVARVLPVDTIYLSEDSVSYELIHYIQLGNVGSCCCLLLPPLPFPIASTL